ncbi:hypothetical protein H9P43_001568 [Blastocladiella emersonii ATCC 22665]|nr:hypothetical protein H9P43_001568 [Blastocladiella emersonii ATCC 22665]
MKVTMSTTLPQSTPFAPRNVSGRVWKEKKTKVSTMRAASVRKSYEERMQDRQMLKVAKEHAQELKDAKLRAKEEAKQRRIEQEERRRINTLKAEVVQSVSSRKVKRMSKKQLRASGITMRATGLIPAIVAAEAKKTAEYQAEQRAAAKAALEAKAAEATAAAASTDSASA